MTIFVSIASYRDPELIPTVLDCLAKADRPADVHLGVCWQHGPGEDISSISGNRNIRILEYDWRDSEGACWARAEAMSLYRGENYYLQIDSHHRFEPGWDLRLIAALKDCESTRPLLGTYCPPYDPRRCDLPPSEPTQMSFHYFTEGGIPMYRPEVIADWKEATKPMRARFVSAHFLFVSGSFVDEVPYDPKIYFHGEEILLAVRAFTWGYDLFHPTEVLLRHEYSREHRPKHWDDHVVANNVEVPWHQRDESSIRRVQQLLTAPQSSSGIFGTSRTVAQYEKYAGISFRHRKVQDYTLFGGEPPNPTSDPDWHNQIHVWHGTIEIELESIPFKDIEDLCSCEIELRASTGRILSIIEVHHRILETAMAGGYTSITFQYQISAGTAPQTWSLRPVGSDCSYVFAVEGFVEVADHR